MSRVINISGLTPVDDPEYRYKMTTVVGKVEGRGNGIKTVIANVTDVALGLHRDPGEVNKFFGCELGAQTTWNGGEEVARMERQEGARSEATKCIKTPQTRFTRH